MKPARTCLECGLPISPGVHSFSQRIYGHPLCMRDLFMIEESGATARTVDLYLALKSRGFPLVLEYFDGFKRVDMALPDKLYIEVTEYNHHDHYHSILDLTRTVDSPEKNIPVIVISLALLESRFSFDHAVQEISKACVLMLKKPKITERIPMLTAAQLQ
jgi:hypothetical protein